MSFAQTHNDINAAAFNDYEKADKELNAVYKEILKEYNTDTAFLKNLKTVQKIWIQFRDAEASAMYPNSTAGNYGTIHPLCWYTYMKGLTEERTNKLKTWLTGIAEGDACAGSVKRK